MRASEEDSIVYFNVKFLGEDGGKNLYVFWKEYFLSLLSFSVNGDKNADEEKEKSLYPPTLCR